MYTKIRRFGWDGRKSARNLRERGFDLAFATIFDRPTLEQRDARRGYGEDRIVAVGSADGIVLTVVYTDRVEGGRIVRRIISARKSNRHEREAYFAAIEKA